MSKLSLQGQSNVVWKVLNSQDNSALVIVRQLRAGRTWESDVKALVGDGEIWDEAQLGLEIAIETCIDGRRQLGAREPSERLHETPVLRDEQIVVVVLEMKGVKVELDSCWETKEIKDISYPIGIHDTCDLSDQPAQVSQKSLQVPKRNIFYLYVEGETLIKSPKVTLVCKTVSRKEEHFNSAGSFRET